MTALIRTYPSEPMARRAIEALRVADVSQGVIRLMTGARLGDVRRQQVGSFAGSLEPDARVGTYGSTVVVRRQAHGGFAGDPDRKRQGSFADTDRVVIVSYEGDAERTRITGLGGARRLLARDGLDEATVDRAVGDLHRGQAVVLLDPPPSRLTSSGCIILGVRNT